jgi:hypothetical protein
LRIKLFQILRRLFHHIMQNARNPPALPRMRINTRSG